MITICDNRGVCIDHMDDLLKNENIGIMLSEGTDSTLVLYLMAKYINDLNLHETHTILPIHYRRMNYRYNTLPNIFKILDFVKKEFPRVHIFDLLIKEYIDLNDFEDCVIPIDKKIYWKDFKKRIKKCGFVDAIYTGGHGDPRDHEPVLDYESELDPPGGQGRIYEKHRGPFFTADKRFIGYLYKKFNLMETLFPLTISCVLTNLKTGMPCKHCNGCRDKYYGFGCYDNLQSCGVWDKMYDDFDYSVGLNWKLKK